MTFLTLLHSNAAAYTLTANTGTFALTGNNTGLTAQRTLTAAVGTFTLTGNATGLKASRLLPASTATFTLTGIATGLKAGRLITASSQSFALTGVAASFSLGRSLSASQASFVLTGQGVSFAYVSTFDPLNVQSSRVRTFGNMPRRCYTMKSGRPRYLEKPSTEKRPLTVAYTDRLPEEATVSSCSVAGYNMTSKAADNSVISSTTAIVTTETANVFLQAGVGGVQYKITFQATLSDGSIFEDDVLMRVKDL